jgi:large subunit ribosomal protein L31
VNSGCKAAGLVGHESLETRARGEGNWGVSEAQERFPQWLNGILEPTGVSISIQICLLIKKILTFAVLKISQHGQIHAQRQNTMRKDIHPKSYRLVVFKDMSNEYAFLSRSTAPTKETIVWEDGNEYPLVKVEISHMSHPFYTGKSMFVDTAGRIEKFKQRYAKKK